LLCVREEQARQLAEARAAQQNTPWFRLRQRSYWRSQANFFAAQLDSSSGRVTDRDVRELATRASDILWTRAAGEVIPKRNSYGPAGASHFDMVLSKAMESRDELVPFFTCWNPPKLAEVPIIHEVVTEEFIAKEARTNIERLAVIAASPTLLHKEYRDVDGNTVIVIQHVESGLRARFTLQEPGFGSVASKPYNIQSIDPENPGVSGDWGRYVGLGIGRRIYQEANRLEPGVRWRSSLLSDYSAPLRAKLHASDPYIWALGSCQWCDKMGQQTGIYFWEQMSEAFFAGHPQ
jgi:hypothetical protein